MVTAAIGTLGKLGIGTTSTVDQRLDFRSEGVAMAEEFINTNGVRGTLAHSIERVRAGAQRIRGPLTFEPTSLELTYLLPWIFAAGTGTPTVSYTPADARPTRFLSIDRDVKVFTYTGVAVNTATFRARQGEALEVELDVVAISEAIGNSGSFPAINIDVTTQPFIFSDCALTAGGTTIKAKEIEISSSFGIDEDRFFNSNQLDSIVSFDRVNNYRTMIPYGAYLALYASDPGGAACVATFTNGSAVLTITLPNVALPRIGPTVGGREEVMLRLEGQGYRDGVPGVGANDITVTLNPGP